MTDRYPTMTTTDPWETWAGINVAGDWSSPAWQEPSWETTTPVTYTFDQPSSMQVTSPFDIAPSGRGMFDTAAQIFGMSEILAGQQAWSLAHPPAWALPAGATGSLAAGQIGQSTGEFAPLNAYDDAFVAASRERGVPANLIKSVAMAERGLEEPLSPSGAIGIMQVMPGDWDEFAQQLGLTNWRTDPAQNIMLGAAILKSNAENHGGNWEEAVKDYIGRGDPDYYGTTAETYWARVEQYWRDLEGGEQRVVTGGWEQNFEVMFGPGSSNVPDWGEFNVPSSNGLYGYGADYGLSGVNHTGIDVPMPVINTPMYAGFSGHVVCAATNWGTGEDSCAKFDDTLGDGAGRIEIISNDGNVVLIYGHSSRTAVVPGQAIKPGDLLGYSGGMNSLHVHLEARVQDPSMPSGWRIVDPRTVLGAATLPQSGLGSTGPGSEFTPVGSLEQEITRRLSGTPRIFYGPDPSSDFTQWMLSILQRSGARAGI